MYDTILIEEFQKPAVALCNEGFITDAISAASQKGMPGVRIVSETVPCECSVPEQIEAGVTAAMDDIIAALSRPLSPEEVAPAKKVEELPAIVFKGDIQEVNRFFYKRGWTDGLPVIPPTEEAVAEILTGTDLPADHVVGKIMPRLGKATVEKIAINAVMAGALPTYMPVLIAAVRALMEPESYFRLWEVSTGSFAPFWIINGPIRNDLHVNSGTGAFSPGNIANAAIGRAMGLIIKNIGGARKGIEDMGSLGNPCKYSMVIAENEEKSPWEPLHVSQGLGKEDSAVTFCLPNIFTQIMPYGTDDRGILGTIIYNIFGTEGGLLGVILNSVHAKTLASKGWTKEQLKVFISGNARVPAYKHRLYWGGTPGNLRKEWLPISAEDSLPQVRDPDWIRIIVAGGAGVQIGLVQGQGGDNRPDINWVTKRVELPANWGELVEKYKNIVPAYVRY